MRSPPTITAPLPHDPRVVGLAAALGIARREAFAAAAEAWGWMLAMSSDGVVVNAAPDSLDAVVELEGFGGAMLEARLIGTADGGIVLPSELRQSSPTSRATGSAEDDAERKVLINRERERIKKQNQRARKKLEGGSKPRPAGPPPAAAAPPPAANPLLQPLTLGSIAGHPVRLLINRKGQPFYKLINASPDLTGSVSDATNPTLKEAALAFAEQRKRQQDTGNGGEHVPSLQQLVDEARRLKDAEAAAAREHDANTAFAEAAAAADDAADNGHANTSEGAAAPPCPRDMSPVSPGHVPLVPGTCPHVPKSVPKSVPPASAPKSFIPNGLRSNSVPNCVPKSVPPAAPSSSNCDSQNEIPEKTTTRTAERDKQRDHEDVLLDRLEGVNPNTYRPTSPEEAAKLQNRRRYAERAAELLRWSVETVERTMDFAPSELKRAITERGFDVKTLQPLTGSEDALETAKPREAAVDNLETEQPVNGTPEPRGDISTARHRRERGLSVISDVLPSAAEAEPGGDEAERLREEGLLAKQGRPPKKITSGDVFQKTSSGVMFLSDLGINRNIAAAGSTATVSARPLAPPDTLKAQAPEELHDDDS